MQLQEVLDHLSNNELSQISIGKQDPGVINDVNREKVVSTISLGLTELHKRFHLREDRLTVHLNPDTTVYKLDRSKVGKVAAVRDMKYLEQLKLFALKGTLLKVLRVTTPNGYELGLNDLGDPYSLRTPRFDLLEVPEAMVKNQADLPEYLSTDTLEVFYKANHPKLGKWENGTFANGDVYTDGDMDMIQVDIPEAYLTPLLLWVASRFHNPIGMSNEFHAGNSYAQKYEMACMALETANLQIDQGSQVSKLRARGFV